MKVLAVTGRSNEDIKYYGLECKVMPETIVEGEAPLVAVVVAT